MIRNFDKFLNGKFKVEPLVLGQLLVFFSTVLYWPVISFQYLDYDDPEWIFANPIVLSGISLGSLRWAVSGVVNSTWCPLTNLTFIMECQFFGAHASVSHFI